MFKKKELKIKLAKIRRLMARYFPQIRLGLIGLVIIFAILVIRVMMPSLITGARLTGNLISGGLSLISQSPEDLKGENNRVNLLLLGVSGEEKAGADLTDTIIFVSINPQTGNTLMLSLPRDVWLASMRAKLNTAYHYGNQKKPGGGLVLAKASVAEILNQPVDFGVVIDFSGFEQIVDLLGGVTIKVENSFDDFRYPIPGKENDDCNGDPEYGCRYEHLHFEAGEQKVDGETALKYVRSRYAEGEEGTDYARSRRQQQLLTAIKDELFSFKVLGNPLKIIQLLKLAQENFETDISQQNWGGFIKLLLEMRAGDLNSEILDGGVNGQEGYLINPPANPQRYDNHWVLIPRTGDWREIQAYVQSLLENN
jgi:LCP family protein required for cell wall assembly